MNHYKFDCSGIYNVDEMGIPTVQRPDKILVRQGVKQIGSLISAELGTLVTAAISVTAAGNTIPPIFVFPRKHYREYFANNGPPGCIGTANQSGWMDSTDFFKFLEHFVRHT